MHVKEIMTSPVHVIWQNDPVENAAELMTAKSVTALPVVDADGLLVGMVADSDLLKGRVPPDVTAHQRRRPDPDPHNRPAMVEEVMSRYPVTTTPDTDVAKVAEQMLEHNIRSLPVVQNRNVVGIISRRDLIRALVRSDDVLAREVRHRLDEYAAGEHRWTVTVETGIVTVAGDYLSETERTVVEILARTVPGVAAVRLDAVPSV
ncbi:CBS domain-containing protein [Actinoplanes lobatus]|uniref:CBS domain-containing protein n=1 Tax=Actinoplanes lobatus TaxID=113568 RepID=A0A7W7MKP6_9ACTN|nr:CBS domain-containing protein [Actinoplanes lobatus]MBB4753586.1 CBS domain-containing protein [Actinoplanes lobatus]GGN84681.1 CBS domain-containing protein [Actinoplanes lobatus]GIE38123.1 CBS domain-containing protein [Actinoplanes lobatus]